MNICFTVINNVDKFENLLSKFHEKNLHGGTIFDTMGMARVMSESGGLSHTIRGFLNKGRPFNKTIMMVVTDDELIKVKEAFEEVLGNIEEENVGIIVSFPVSNCWGIRPNDRPEQRQ